MGVDADRRPVQRPGRLDPVRRAAGRDEQRVGPAELVHGVLPVGGDTDRPVAAQQAPQAPPTVAGFVRNESDGSVYAEVEGFSEKVGEFIRWSRRGPPNARVESVKVEDKVLCGETDFDVRY